MMEMNKSVVNNIYSLLSLVGEFDALPSLIGQPHVSIRRSMLHGINS